MLKRIIISLVLFLSACGDENWKPAQVTTAAIDFGECRLLMPEQRTVLVSNPNHEPITVDVRMEGEDAANFHTGTAPFEIEGGQAVYFPVVFRPTSIRIFTATVYIGGNQVLLRGEGI